MVEVGGGGVYETRNSLLSSMGVSLFGGMERWNGMVEWNGGME